jgi:hypothetical protein
MSWSFGLMQRNKIALAFAAIFVIIVLANWLVSFTMERVSRNFQSVYQDRLIPSMEISEILERYYQNRMLLEEHVMADDTTAYAGLKQRIATNTQTIDLLVDKFEHTYLVDKELEELATYKKQFANLVLVQDKILNLSADGNKAEAKQLYRAEGQEAFQDQLVPLHALIRVQGDVGQELYQSADRSVKMLKVLSYLVIGLAVIVALIVGTLLQTSRKLNNVKPQKYHMN